MALDLKQPDQATEPQAQQHQSRVQAQQKTPVQPKPLLTSSTRTASTRLSQENRFDRSSTQRHSKTPITYPLEIQLKEATKPQLAGLVQPSKLFTNKCKAELQALLETIRPEYHNDIKSLNNDETHADLFIKVGDVELKKPLHKCILASRAFKFYSALRGFKVQTSEAEKDIIEGQFQAANIEQTSIPSNLSSPKDAIKEEQDQLSEATLAKRKEDQLREALEVFNCELPDSIVNLDLLLNFVRRAYLDQDLSEDETHLHLLILNYLKLHKPELFKNTGNIKHSPDHRESFRTIQPDFEQLSISDSNMSAAEQSSEPPKSGPTDADESNADEDNSQRDDSQAVSSLTRTETFEMISRNNPDSPLVDLDDEDDKDRSEFSVNTSESSEPYTPVTRTGLKPKKFTTPVGMKTNRSNKNTPASSVKKNESSDVDVAPSLSKASATNPVAQSDCVNKSSSGVSSTSTPPIASKRSSLFTNNTGSSPNPDDSPAQLKITPLSTTKSRAAPKTSTSTPTSKLRQTVITRAHPISLERSQSPGTSLSKGSTKNFIAANKKLISQMERRVIPSSQQGDQQAQINNEDSENEVSDASMLALTEPLTTENLAAQVDKFTLVSYSKLADALSKMLIGGILTDTIVLAGDNKEINAHKCILAVRSAYLSDEIKKQCLPSMTSESPTRQLIRLDLTEFSYPAVYFALMHIYSGIVKVPEDLELEELAKISHLLHVGTLRQVCMHNLRMNYCHYFHKPCNVCCIGVLKTLPLAWRYDLTDLYTKCLQWIGSHFAQIFCLEEFSNLKPHDLIEECYKETLSQLTPDNVIQKTIECQKLLKSLPRVKWTESVICLVGRQLEDFCHYVADNYEKILQSESFLNLGKSCWECEVLEENLLAAMNHLKPDSGCKTLIQLDKIECSIETYCDEPRAVSETFAHLISKMRKYCERYLLKEAPAVVHCTSWRQMTPSLQKRIKDQALLSTDFDEPTRHLAAKPKLPSMARHHQQTPTLLSSPSPQPNNPGSDTISPSNRSTPDSRHKSPNTTFLPPPKTKPAAARHVKVLK